MSDQFGVSTQQNLLTGGDGAKLYGWNLLNSANATIADVNITNAGLLTLLASVTADPNNATFTVPFVYQNITGDFDIDTYMAQSNPGTKRYGLICRDPNASAGEDWLGLVNENGGTSYNNTINSVTSQYAAGGTAFAYYRITRVGSVFTAYNKINSGDSWSAVGQVITRNDFAGTIQVGLYSTNDALAGNRTVFDYFEGTNSGGAASITTTALASSL
ncbi:MAG: hypothetical protein HQK97_11735, partial [Nitrospirae bacterium]|nr:hypothetical protein [Nitrospirota bacterium]